MSQLGLACHIFLKRCLHEPAQRSLRVALASHTVAGSTHSCNQRRQSQVRPLRARSQDPKASIPAERATELPAAQGGGAAFAVCRQQHFPSGSIVKRTQSPLSGLRPSLAPDPCARDIYTCAQGCLSPVLSSAASSLPGSTGCCRAAQICRLACIAAGL